ncbi:hypothetical protein [Parasitella parasitica]|uniref:Uncharacterized protein n=1 Tax=Parasitella parasitica TaxID=35722 RepID=A0A0B7N5H8_9FUNG|nr:hypothetical protein [Parasitella parasitica]
MKDKADRRNTQRIQRRIDNEKSRELSVVDYGRIVGAWEWGGSFGRIAAEFGIGKTTVKSIIDRYLETGSPLPAKRPGAAPKLLESQKSDVAVDIQRKPMDTYTDH